MQHFEEDRDERIVGKRCFRGHRNTTRNEPPNYQRINQRILMIYRDQQRAAHWHTLRTRDSDVVVKPVQRYSGNPPQ
jgi:hypothetical protein